MKELQQKKKNGNKIAIDARNRGSEQAQKYVNMTSYRGLGKVLRPPKYCFHPENQNERTFITALLTTDPYEENEECQFFHIRR